MKTTIFIIACIMIVVFPYIVFKRSSPVENSSTKDSPPIREVLLEIAVREGNIDGVKKQLDDGAIPTWWNWKEARGWNQGIPKSQVKPEIAKLLVEAGADPNDFENGWSYSKTTPKKRKQALKLELKGNEAEDRKDYETARKMYLEALALDPYLYSAKRSLKNIKN